MKNSKLTYLKQINKITLAAGHGGDGSLGNNYDSGSAFNNNKEADQTIILTNKISELLRKKNLDIEVVPHNLNLGPTIDWINQKYKNVFDTWAIEIHRDSFNFQNPNLEEISNRCGVYYYTDYPLKLEKSSDPQSTEIGIFLKSKYIEYGASPNTWARPDYVESGKFHLGFVHRTNTVASIIELGFMQGYNNLEHLDKLALWTAMAIYEAFTGDKYLVEQPQLTPPVVVPAPVVILPPPTEIPQEIDVLRQQYKDVEKEYDEILQAIEKSKEALEKKYYEILDVRDKSKEALDKARHKKDEIIKKIIN